jgi:hypothetical protein
LTGIQSFEVDAGTKREGPDVSGLETAIRTALDNSDRNSAEVRARIYQSARQALEAGLRKQDITDADVVAHHRHRLETTIHTIESEERTRLHPRQGPPEVPVPPVVEMPEPPRHVEEPAYRVEEAPYHVEEPPYHAEEDDSLAVTGETRGHDAAGHVDDASLDGVHASSADQLGAAPGGEMRATSGKRGGMDFRPERAAVRRRPRKFFSRLLVWCVLLAFIGMGGWWAYTSGLLLTAAQRDTSVANPPASTQPEDFDGEDSADNSTPHVDEPLTIDPQNGFSADWIEVFKPADKIESGPRARVENVTETEGPAVRLTSQSGNTDGNVSINVPANVLQQLAGKSSTIALTLQSTTDEPTQITVECEFQSLGNCARHRFNVTREKSDALLQVRFDRSLAPNSAGRLMINSDVDGKARGINLFAVRILPGQ